MRGIGKNQIKQQEKSEKRILKFMKSKSVNDPTQVQWCHNLDDTGKCFWLRGIVRGTNLDYNTVTKAVDRLLKKGKILEWSKTHHVRIFQLTSKNSKETLRDIERGLINPNDLIKIPRGNTPKKQQRHILKKQLDILSEHFFKMATPSQVEQLKKILYRNDTIKDNKSEYVIFMKKITGLKFPKTE